MSVGSHEPVSEPMRGVRGREESEGNGLEDRGTRGEAALLIIDLINDMSFDDADAMMPRVIAAAHAVRALREKADAAGVAVVYVNDNFDQWHSERLRLIDYCRTRNDKARALIDIIHPRDDDFFLIKPRHSGFYATNLPVLLPRLGATRLILTGIAADICVLFTAADAHMRDYRLWCPSDCVAATTPDRAEWALEVMRSAMQVEIRPSRELDFGRWLDLADRQELWRAGRPSET